MPNPFDFLNPPFLDDMRFELTNRVPDRAAYDYANPLPLLESPLFPPRSIRCNCARILSSGVHFVGCPNGAE